MDDMDGMNTQQKKTPKIAKTTRISGVSFDSSWKSNTSDMSKVYLQSKGRSRDEKSRWDWDGHVWWQVWQGDEITAFVCIFSKNEERVQMYTQTTEDVLYVKWTLSWSGAFQKMTIVFTSRNFFSANSRSSPTGGEYCIHPLGHQFW